jgi:streptomycin 6-kinase
VYRAPAKSRIVLVVWLGRHPGCAVDQHRPAKGDALTSVADAAAHRHDVRMLDLDLLLDADSRDRLVARFGEGVHSWLAALPGLVELCCQRWHLELDDVVPRDGCCVFTGRQYDARGVVLKLTPDLAIAAAEALALRAWAGTAHVVDLIDAKLDAGALLLEKIEPGTEVSDQQELPEASEMAELLTGLRCTPGDYVGQLPTLAQRMDAMFSLTGGLLSNPRVSPLVAPSLLAHGHRLARELAAAGGAPGLLHGDLHLSNILHGGPGRGLVAIDPGPRLGDRAWDAIEWTLGRATSTAEIHDRAGQLCALVPALDRDRFWRWCQATAAAIAVLQLRRRPPDDTT